MKKAFLAALFAFSSCTVFAQFQVGSAQVPTGGKAGALSDDDLETFKKTTTIFTIQPRDMNHIEDFKKSIADVWKVTPFEVVSNAEAGKYRLKKNSLFSFGGFVVTRTSSSGMTSSNTHISYDLTIPDYNRKGDLKGRTILARFILSPDFETVNSVSEPGNGLIGRKRREEERNQLSKRGEYANWGAGQIRGYLKAINDHLAEGERRGIMDEIRDKTALKALAKDTLYLPMYLKDVFNPFTGSEKTKDDDGDDEAGDAYPFPHRFVNEDELEKMLVYATKPIYHLIYVRSSTNKYVSVVEAMSGTIIYSDFKNLSYNFKMKDLKAIAKLVE